ncbi:MAG: TRAP transporter large permease [Alphaproteobacteria bacterium]|jgi:C4-dicarboxylate transporter, DctM subunit|nr:TRAP transporter large permease [Alphaproteobacteria bacterium]
MLEFSVIGLLLVLLMLGMPVAFSLLIAGTVGIHATVGFSGMYSQLSSTAYRSAAESTLAAIPLFILMAELMSKGGMARDVFNAANKFFGKLPGGVSIATVIASAGFAAVSGSSTAAAGSLSAISMPEFRRLGYGLSAATGIIAVAGTLAVMIPPSIAFLIYGIMTETSIGRLLIAGIIPGLMTAAIYSIGIYIWARLEPQTLPRGEDATRAEKLEALRGIWGFLAIIGLVFFSLYGGVATTTETAAVAAFSTLVYLSLAGRLSPAKVWEALVISIRLSTMMLTIVIGAILFGYFLTITRLPQDLIAAIGASGMAPWMILAMILIVYLILGCLMDQIAILLITLPVTFPLVVALGFDPIWYGVIVVKTVEIGLVTPPVGMNVFVVSAATGVPPSQVFRGTGYMLIFEAITLALLLSFPALSTWLPSQMMN